MPEKHDLTDNANEFKRALLETVVISLLCSLAPSMCQVGIYFPTKSGLSWPLNPPKPPPCPTVVILRYRVPTEHTITNRAEFLFANNFLEILISTVKIQDF